MVNLPITVLPNSILRAPTHKVSRFDDNLTQLVHEMRATMHSADGIGLAAPQIGESLKLAVIEYAPPKDEAGHESDVVIPFLMIANPSITQMNDVFEVSDEGCLSIPWLQTPVPRATEVSVLAHNEHGERIRIRAKGLLARILQHEIDHLNGILIVDRTTDRKVRKEYD
jgi:peptide deformylase